MYIILQAPNYYPHCDGGGCGTNACDGIAGQYGPGLLMMMMINDDDDSSNAGQLD